MVEQIAAGRGPYFQYLERITQELAPYKTATDRNWVRLAFRFKETRKQAAAAAAASKSGGAIARAADRALQRLQSKTGTRRADTADISQSLTDRFAAGTALSDYESALLEISENITNRRSAFDITSETFSKAETPNLSPKKYPGFSPQTMRLKS